MDCKTARRLMDSCRPPGDDWQLPELAAVATHLEECSDCLDQFRARQALDERVAVALLDVPVPEHLQDRILIRLNHARVWRFRRFVRPLIAAAAVLMLTVVLANWLHSTPERVSIGENPRTLGEHLIAAVEEHDSPGSDRLPDRRAGVTEGISIEEWLQRRMRELRVTGPLTSRLPLSSFSAVWKTSVAGQAVAVFEFDDSRREADVLAFPHNRFDPGKLTQVPQPIYSTRAFVVVAWTEQDTTYVAVLRGWSDDEWKPLVRRPGGYT